MTTKLIYILTIPNSALWYLKGQLNYMQNHHYDVTFISSQGSKNELQQVEYNEQVKTLTLEVSREIDLKQDIRSVLELNRILGQVKPQIVNFGNPKTGLVGGIVSFLRGTSVRIYTLHGLRLETATGLKRWVLWLSEKITMACAHRIVAVSPSLMQTALDLGLTKRSKIMTLGRGSVNGVPLMAADPAAVQALRNTLDIPEEAVVFGFVGRFTRDKGIQELVAAFTKLRSSHPQTVLLLVGDYEEGDPVDAATRKRILEGDGIIWPGYTSDITTYYAIMDVLVLPTYREGFPTVVLEGGAMGLPAITTTATGARDAVIDRVTGLVVPVGRVSELHDAMQELTTRKDLRLKYGRNAFEMVNTDYEQTKIWAAWDTLYRELLDQNQHHRIRSHLLSNPRFWAGFMLRIPLIVSGLAILHHLFARHTSKINTTKGSEKGMGNKYGK